jgi:uncharacterized cupin superfamily protein
MRGMFSLTPPCKCQSLSAMKKVNISELPEMSWQSPAGKFGCHDKEITEALGGISKSTDLSKRHPFDVEIMRLQPGKSVCPYHSHSAQWEFYIILSGQGSVRDEHGVSDVFPGDAFVFAPKEAHQITNNGPEDLIFYVIADNPLSDFCYYPDSRKWSVLADGKRAIVQGEIVDYYRGEE